MSDITNYLQSIEDRIDAINTCDALQAASDAIKSELDKLIQDLTDQQNALALQMVVPVDLVTTIAWIKAQIDATAKPIAEMIAETTLVITKVTEILAKLADKISNLGCTFTPPSIP